jgi:streptomycin 6-kinase
MQEKLEVYVERWQLKNPELIATTPTSHIYRVESNDGVCALKLLTEIGVADEWGGALALAYYDA